MTFADMVRARLVALGHEQRELARAVDVTDSYISQLLTRRKAPPSSERTDIYPRMEAFLRLRPGELTKVVELERTEEARRKLARPPEPLFREFRELVLRKCVHAKRGEVLATFEERPFGILEQLVTQTLLECVQEIARKELESESWLRLAAHVGGRSHEEMRVIVLDFLDTDVFQVSNESCVAFLDPLVDSWDIELPLLRMHITLNDDLVRNPRRTYAFQELAPADPCKPPTGLRDFLQDPSLSADVTEDELRLLGQQTFDTRQPTKFYYYRALQNLRDPVHFSDR